MHTSATTIAPPLEAGATAHYPALDGVRGLAILLVITFHYARFQPQSLFGKLISFGVQSGWVGVDLFFVLSGFLITGILLDTRHQPRFFLHFYARRFLRIFPLYYSVLLVSFLVLPALFRHTGFHGPYPDVTNLLETVRHQKWYWGYLSNFWMGFHGMPGNGLSVVWSLSIEEQFYLIWPLLVFSLSKKRLALLCAVLITAAFVLRVILVSYRMNLAVYLFSFCRIDTLATGALCAIIVRSPTGLRACAKSAKVLLLALLTAFCFACYHYFTPLNSLNPRVQIFGYPGLSLLFGSLILALMTLPHGSLLNRLFTNTCLTFLGKYSYALYLFHLSIFYGVQAYFREYVTSSIPIIAITALALSVAAALCSWRIIERPLLRLKVHFQ